MKYVEFYPRKQGRPYQPRTIDLEAGVTLSQLNANNIQDEYVELLTTLEDKFDEQISRVEEILLELKQIKLHMASMSDESIEDNDVGEE